MIPPPSAEERLLCAVAEAKANFLLAVVAEPGSVLRRYHLRQSLHAAAAARTILAEHDVVVPENFLLALRTAEIGCERLRDELR